MAFDPETGQDTPEHSSLLESWLHPIDGNAMFGDAFDALKLGGGPTGAYSGKVIDGQIYATGRGENINVTARTKEAVAFFQSKDGGGWTEQQAVGIVANLATESGLKTDIVGDGGQAYGLAQWHGDRRAVYAKKFGHAMNDPSLSPDQRFREQLQFVNYELHNSEHVAGNHLRNASSAGESAAIVSSEYERPLRQAAEMAIRAAKARTLETKLGNEAVAIAGPTGDPVHPQHVVMKNETAQNVTQLRVAANEDAPKPTAKAPDEEEKRKAQMATAKPAQVAANNSFPVPKGPLSTTF